MYPALRVISNLCQSQYIEVAEGAIDTWAGFVPVGSTEKNGGWLWAISQSIVYCITGDTSLALLLYNDFALYAFIKGMPNFKSFGWPDEGIIHFLS